MHRDLDNVVLWAQKWQMEFNVKKCKVMHVESRLTAVSTTWDEASRGHIGEGPRSLDFD